MRKKNLNLSRLEKLPETELLKLNNEYNEIIKDNNVEVIYTIDPVENTSVYKYIDKNCFNEIKISNILNSFEIKQCQDING